MPLNKETKPNLKVIQTIGLMLFSVYFGWSILQSSSGEKFSIKEKNS